MSPAFLAGTLCALVVAGNLVSLAVAWIRIRRRAPVVAPERAGVPVSIVRPVCGIETFSEETLRSGFRLDYPAYEMIFCVADRDDPIIPLAERLMREHPEIPSRLLVGEDLVSDNPKLNNCVKGWDEARHDWIVMADSNLVMPPDYLQRLLASWRPDTGLVCSTPAGSRPEGFWAEVECAFLNTLQARWQYAGEALGFGFAQGKSMLWQRSILETRGGIRALAQETAEDAAATKIVRRAGLHVHLVDSPFEQPLGSRTAPEVWARQLRWARLRRVTFALFFAPELFSGPLVPLALGIYAALASGFSVSLTAAAVIVPWYAAELELARRTGWFRSWRLPLAFVVRDLLIVPMWVSAWFAEDIVWRGNAMTIRTRPAPLSAGS